MRETALPRSRRTDHPVTESAKGPRVDTPRSGIAVTGLQMLVVLGLSLVILSRFISPTPQFDEFYHVLAAQSLLSDGTLKINEGGADYTRARAYTYAVAACYWALGESWASARLPSLICGALLVTACFGWLQRVATTRAAWIGAFLMMLSPGIIGYSSMVRFYIPHALFVWLSAVCAYVFVTGKLSVKSRLAVVVLGMGCAAMATHLQVTTSIAALIVTVWAGMVFAVWLVRCDRQQFKWAMLWMLLVLVIAVPAFWFGLQASGYGAHLIEKFQTPRLWSLTTRSDYRYFHRYFAETYPMLWAGFAFAAIVALARRPGPAWFCLVFFGLAFVIHSCLPFKAPRYLVYAWPFFFLVWAIALDGLLAWLVSQGRVAVGHVFGESFAAGKTVGVGVGLVVLIGFLGAGWVTPEYKLARKMLTGESLGAFQRSNWASVQAKLKPIVEQTGFVMTSSPPRALYYLGRHDIAVSVTQAAGRDEFEHDRITGRPVVTTPESIQRVMDEHPSGLIVMDRYHFGARYYVPADTAEFIQTHTQPIEIDESTRIMAYTWGLDDPLLSDR